MPDYNFNTFLVGHMLRNDPKRPKKKPKPASKKFWIAVFVIMGIVLLFGIFEIIMGAWLGWGI